MYHLVYMYTLFILTFVTLCYATSNLYLNASERLGINWVWPNQGSIAGGTRIYISGNGFNSDAYTGYNLVYFVNSEITIPCREIAYYTTETEIVCDIEAPSNANTYGEPLNVVVAVNGSYPSSCNSLYCQFVLSSWSTPYIKTISPKFGGYNTEITIGFSKFEIGKDTGDVPCNILNDDGELNKIQWDWRIQAYAIKCRVQNTVTGSYNVSITNPAIGNAVVTSNAKYLQFDTLNTFSFQLIPVIDSVSPQSINLRGGNIISIHGSGFGSEAANVTVSIGGLPCVINSLSENEITCTTPLLRQASNIGSRYEDFLNENFSRIRGLNRYVWRNVSRPYSLQDVLAVVSNNSSQSDVTYSSQYFSDENFYVTMHKGFFIPPSTNTYKFMINSDDSGAIYLSTDESPSNKEMIAYVQGYTWSFYQQKNQISDAIQLEGGKPYYIEIIHGQGGGSGYMKVGVKLDFTSVFETDSFLAQNEEQEITASISPTTEKQIIEFENETTEVISTLVSFGNRSFEFLSNFTAEELQKEVIDILSFECEYPNDDILDFYIHNIFEEVSELWQSYDGAYPQIDGTERFCGMSSLYQNYPSSINYYFNSIQAGSGFRTKAFPYICMAYRVPFSTKANMLINIQDMGWKSIVFTMEPEQSWGYEPVATWSPDDGTEPIIGDNDWHYKCINIHSQLSSTLGEQTSGYRIMGIAWGFPPGQEKIKGDLWIDEFSVSSQERIGNFSYFIFSNYIVNQVNPGALDYLNLKVRTVMIENHETSDKKTWTIELVPYNCGSSFPLLQIPSDQFQVHRLQSASYGLGGFLQFQLNDSISPFFSVYSSDSSIQSILLDSFGIDTKVITKDSTCELRKFSIHFNTPGQQTNLELISNLTGTNPTSTIKEINLGGGLYIIPIEQDMLRTFTTSPQVIVTVNGISSSCSQQESCTVYTFESPLELLNVSTDSAFYGDVIQFSTSANIAEVEIYVGNYLCENLNTSSVIECIMPELPAGEYNITLRSSVYGNLKSQVIKRITSKLEILSITPNISSKFGGALITISGRGFGEGAKVLIGDTNCHIVSYQYNEIQCNVDSSNSGTVDVHVDLTKQVASLVESFTFSNESAVITNITPGFISGFFLISNLKEKIPCTGYSNVIIEGRGFLPYSNGNTITIGDQTCEVISATENTINCSIGKLNNIGIQNVIVNVKDFGNADSTQVSFECYLSITQIYPDQGSLFGGTKISIFGSGFEVAIHNKSRLNVLFTANNKNCEIETVTATRIDCITPSTTSVHKITNNAVNPKYGLGYSWNPRAINITQGDYITWSWTSSPFTSTVHSVEQVNSSDSQVYNGIGFRSQKTKTGTFTHVFNYPPFQLFYISGDYGAKSMQGNITINELEGISSEILVIVDSIPVSSPFYFNFSTLRSPIIQSIFPNVFAPPTISSILVDTSQVYGCSQYPSKALCVDYPHDTYPKTWRVIEFNRTAAQIIEITLNIPLESQSYQVSMWEIEYDEILVKSGMYKLSEEHLHSILTCNTSSELETTITCYIDTISAGVYSLSILSNHFGNSFSLNQNDLLYVIPFVESISETKGSQGGGLELTINGLHFSSNPDDVIVKIGSSECKIISSSFSKIICETTVPIQSGYSTSILEDKPALYLPLGDRSSSQYSNKGFTSSTIIGNEGSQIKSTIAVGILNNNVEFSTKFRNGSFVVVPYSSRLSLNTKGSFSIEFWFLQEENMTSDYRFLIGSFESSPQARGFQFYLSSCGTLEFWIGTGTNQTLDSISCSIALSGSSCSKSLCSSYTKKISRSDKFNPIVNHYLWNILESSVSFSQWHHVVGVYDSISNFISLYLDGILVDSSLLVNVYAPVKNNAGILVGGGIYNLNVNLTNTKNFSGSMDEISIYNKVLSSDIIAEHFFFGTNDLHPIYVVSGSFSASCGISPCVFEYSRDSTPIISQIGIGSLEEGNITFDVNQEMPQISYDVEGVNASTLTIHGSGFGGNISMNRVLLGMSEIECPITSSSEVQIQCNVPALVAGVYDINVIVSGKGRALVARSNFTNTCNTKGESMYSFQYAKYPSFIQKLAATSFSPESGSIGGGTLVTISGHGFSPVVEENFVTFQNSPCEIIESDFTLLKCVTSASLPSIQNYQFTASVFPFSSNANPLSNGLIANYYFYPENTPLFLPTASQAPSFSQVISGIHFPSGSDPFNSSLSSSTIVSGSISGFIRIKSPGEYQFKFTTDVDLSGIWINGILLLQNNNYNDKEYRLPTLATSTMHFGIGFHSIKILFAKKCCGITLSLSMQGYGIPSLFGNESNIPSDMLFYSTTGELVNASEGILLTSQVFSYSNSKTPKIDSISPSVVSFGDLVLINGSQFNANPRVWIGDTEVNVIDASSESIVIQIPYIIGGYYPVKVFVEGMGLNTFTNQQNNQIYLSIQVSFTNSSYGSFGGGFSLIIQGTGFGSSLDLQDPSDTEIPRVTLCGMECFIQEFSYYEIHCYLSSILDLSIVPSSNWSIRYESLPDTLNCTLEFKYRDLIYSQNSAFTLSKELTPTITSVSPRIGGTGGGTIISIEGSLFSSNCSENEVQIGDSLCNIINCSSSTIVCKTSAHKFTTSVPVIVNVLNKGDSLPVTTDATFQYVDRWCSKYTWGGADPPAEGESVYIGPGQTILLDCNTSVLNLILIEGGSLIFADTQDVSLDASYIFVTKGGVLEVGTESKPFIHQATITLHGNIKSPEIPVYGSKVIGIREGRIDLHGIDKGITWTSLSNGITPGDTIVHLTDSVNWSVGDELVISPSGFSPQESEKVTILSVSDSGKTLEVTPAIKYCHSSYTYQIDGKFISLRTEVGLLSRNVKVIGSTSQSVADQEFGATIMIHSKQFVTARFSNIEVANAGQAFRLGRYPIHFHRSNALGNSFVKKCSVHDTFNRGITIHAVNNLLVEDNIVYKTRGHSIFLEDGIERNNKIIHNLVIGTTTSMSLLNTDQTPACFWITNPGNSWINNTCAGSSHNGFWFKLESRPTGPSSNVYMCPVGVSLQNFSQNTAHSNGRFGMWIWENYDPRDSSNGCGGNPTTAIFDKFTSYRNTKGVEIMRVGALQFNDVVLVENKEVNFEVNEPEVNNWGDCSVSGIIDADSSVFAKESGVSDTEFCNEDPNESTATYIGFMTPIHYGFVARNLTFANFQGSSPAITSCSHCVLYQGGFETRFEGIKFINVEKRGLFPWLHAAVWRDMDGSLTGIKDAVVVPTNPTLSTDLCSANELFSGQLQGSVCTSNIIRSFIWELNPSSLTWNPLTIENSNGATISYYVKQTNSIRGYMFLSPSEDIYNYYWNISDVADIIDYKMNVQQLRNDEAYWIAHDIDSKPNHWNINNIVNGSDSIADPTNPSGSWYYSEYNKQVIYLLRGVEGKDDLSITQTSEFSISFQAEDCPVGGCVLQPPPIMNQIEVRWSNESIWGGSLPEEGSDVVIQPNWRMILDISPPPLRNISILGTLEFEDSQDITLTATYILVFGQFIIGTEEEPFLHEARIRLTGERDSDSWILTEEVTLGSKGIAVFGNLSLHGIPRGISWSPLSQTAFSGSNFIKTSKPIDWDIGNQVVISSTDFNPRNSEVATIVAINEGNTKITLNISLQFNHLGSNDENEIRAEVGLLSRNIIIEGYDEGTKTSEESYGARIIVGRFIDEETMIYYEGKANIENVQFIRSGQKGYTSLDDPRYSIVFIGVNSKSTVTRCSFYDSFNTAIGMIDSTDLFIKENVIYKTIGEAIVIQGGPNSLIGNLVIMAMIWNPTDERNIFGGYLLNGQYLEVRDNVMAGSDRAGFILDYADPCDGDAGFSNNIIRSTLHGIHMRSTMRECILFNAFKIQKTWDYGIFAHIPASIIVRDSIFIENRFSVSLNVIGADPLLHQTSNETVHILNSHFIGVIDSQERDCNNTDIPPFPFCVSFEADAPLIGIMLSSFTKNLGKNPCGHLWHFMESYPAINGATFVVNTTFSNFTLDNCGKRHFAITTNEESPDAMHPIYLSNTTLYSVDLNSKVHFFPPLVKWINPTDCVDMDCDAPKHAIIRDLDGGFMEVIGGGSIFPQAEIRFNDSRVPVDMLVDENGNEISLEKIVKERGIVREKTCSWIEAWNGYNCPNEDYEMLVIESLDADTETRRLSPVALSTEGTTDLLNGPMDHGWCTKYTCLKRISTFFSVVHIGSNYSLYLTSTAPQNMRLHLLNSDESQAIQLAIYYTTPQRLDVYKDDIYIEPTNAEFKEDESGKLFVYKSENNDFIPSIQSFSGANYMQRSTRLLFIVVRGNTPITIVTAPVIMVSFTLDISLEDFFKEELLSNMASVLNIPTSQIRLISTVAEDSRKKNTQSIKVTVEIGSGPRESINSEEFSPLVLEEDENNTTYGSNSFDLSKANEIDNMNELSSQLILSVQSQSISQFIPKINLFSIRLFQPSSILNTSSSPALTQFNDIPIPIPSNLSTSLFLLAAILGYPLPAFTVKIKDQSNIQVEKLSEGWEVIASIRYTNGTSIEGILEGKTQVTVENGIALFNNLTITQLQSNIYLHFKTNIGKLETRSSSFSVIQRKFEDSPTPSSSSIVPIFATVLSIGFVGVLSFVLGIYFFIERKKRKIFPSISSSEVKLYGPGRLFKRRKIKTQADPETGKEINVEPAQLTPHEDPPKDSITVADTPLTQDKPQTPKPILEKLPIDSIKQEQSQMLASPHKTARELPPLISQRRWM